MPINTMWTKACTEGWAPNLLIGLSNTTPPFALSPPLLRYHGSIANTRAPGFAIIATAAAMSATKATLNRFVHSSAPRRKRIDAHLDDEPKT